ncbi:hypothetical protein G7Z17_g11847 [Cylindrodendrum hubeiense]|uniref:Uncharacterized protein n=1 Tax=Cylindrodendrum hubeiense TaxID=595255 RepID=A0A9P5H009_9HYPO|nr:hypothetical protein G7Z17_g11847 [Cylindrodendrum hubeiense]
MWPPPGLGLVRCIFNSSIFQIFNSSFTLACKLTQNANVNAQHQMDGVDPGVLQALQRPLMDFDRIDAAARGPLGSLRILIRTNGAPWLQFGAVLTLLVVGLDPLAQQLVQLRQSLVFEPRDYQNPDKVALISRAPSRKYAMTSFGTGNPNKTNSLQDIDTLIWSMSVIYPDVDWVNSTSPDLRDDSSHLVKWPDVRLNAMECAIHYCVQTIDSAVEGNQLMENIEEATDAIRDPDSWERGPEHEDNLPENIPPDDEIDSLEFDSRYSTVSYSSLVLKFPNNDTEPWYTVGEKSVKSLSAYFQGLFLKNYTDRARVKKEVEKKLGKGAVGFNGASFGPDTDSSMDASPPALNGIWTWSRTNISSTFMALATSMTNEIRRNYEPGLESSSGQDKDHFKDGMMSQFGSVGSLTVVYDIRWEWIGLHGLMLVLVIVFLCITLISSGSLEVAPLWKNSALGTIRRGYEVGDVLSGADTVEDMEAKARKAYVKVMQRDIGEGGAFRRLSNDLSRDGAS